MKTRMTRKINVRMPPSPPVSMSSSCSSLQSSKSKTRRSAASKKAKSHIIYVARIDQLHYTPTRPIPMQRRQPTPPQIDPKALGWADWLHYQCKRFAWVGQMALAIIVFLASRISLGFGVRLNGRDA